MRALLIALMSGIDAMFRTSLSVPDDLEMGGGDFESYEHFFITLRCGQCPLERHGLELDRARCPFEHPHDVTLRIASRWQVLIEPVVGDHPLGHGSKGVDLHCLANVAPLTNGRTT